MSRPPNVDQDVFSSFEGGIRAYGNCTQAAVATILGLTLNEVPPFHHATGDALKFWTHFDEFLASQGYHALLRPGNFQPEGCLYLASGPSKRGVMHTVVMREGKLFHDPHPSRAGLLEVHHVHLLVAIDPFRFKLK